MAVIYRPLAVAFAMALCLVGLAPANAQSFFQSLFGFGSQDRPSTPPGPILPPSYRAPIYLPQTPRDEAPANRTGDGGSYRTLCVRMCDGYYFPMSGSTSRRAFARDAARCSASCGSEARLFYHPASSGDAATMIDLTGRAYSRLPNAFKYRKTMVSGCACKPEPWAESELARHRQYAAADVVARSQATTAVVEKKPDTASQTRIAQPAHLVAAELARETSTPASERSADATEEPKAVVREDRPQAHKRTKRNVATAETSRRSDRPAPVQIPVSTVRQPQPKAGPAGIFGLGAPKQRWPGD